MLSRRGSAQFAEYSSPCDVAAATALANSHDRRPMPTQPNDCWRGGAPAVAARGSTRASAAGGRSDGASTDTPPCSRTNLILRHLPPCVDEEVMEAACAPFGRITSQTVMRNIRTGESLGTAFVRYETHEEARRARAFFHEWETVANSLFRRGKELAPVAGESDVVDHRILSRLSFPSDPALTEALQAVRARCAETGDAPDEKPFLFSLPDSALSALSVQWARKEHDKAPGAADRRLILKLFIRNVPLSMSRDDLAAFFSAFGVVTTVSIHRDTAAAVSTIAMNAAAAAHNRSATTGAHTAPMLEGAQAVRDMRGDGDAGRRHIAFVIFRDEGVAWTAAKAVHNTRPFEECGDLPLMVKLAEEKAPSGAAPRADAPFAVPPPAVGLGQPWTQPVTVGHVLPPPLAVQMLGCQAYSIGTTGGAPCGLVASGLPAPRHGRLAGGAPGDLYGRPCGGCPRPQPSALNGFCMPCVGAFSGHHAACGELADESCTTPTATSECRARTPNGSSQRGGITATPTSSAASSFFATASTRLSLRTSSALSASQLTEQHTPPANGLYARAHGEECHSRSRSHSHSSASASADEPPAGYRVVYHHNPYSLSGKTVFLQAIRPATTPL